jgi:hypothetical protein
LELSAALEQLVQILGAGSESVSAKLLDVLTSDPSGSATWDIAITEAIYDLNELKRELGDKEKQKGMGFHIFVLILC